MSGEFSYIDNAHDLEIICRRWQSKRVLALDTEFVRVKTYFPQLGLIQVADDEGVALIDPLGVGSLKPFAEVLANSAVIKVLHSCSEDLEVFHRGCGVLPNPVFDTQIAASFLGMGMNLGYARLVDELLGIAISKDASRTDWLKRPLSPEQLQYAAADVLHLLEVYHRLAERMANHPHRDWFEEDCQALQSTERFTIEPHKAYKKVKQAFRLSRQQLCVLQELAEWRENEALRRDLIRRYVVSDESLLALALRQPRNLHAMQTMEELSPAELRKHGILLLSLIEKAKQVDESQWPDAIARPHDIPGLKTAMTEAKSIADRIAAEQGIAPELLASNRLLEASLLYEAGKKSSAPKSWTGWRGRLLKTPLAECIHQFRAALG